MNQFFAGPEYTGAPFRIFDRTHLITLGIIVLLNLALLPFRKYASDRGRLWFRYGLAALLILNETAYHLWRWQTGQWTLQLMLPLHLCAVSIYLSAIMLITKNSALYQFLYFMGIGAATQAMLTPDAQIYGFPHFRYFEIFISHGGIVLAAMYMTIVERYRPYWQSILKIAIWLNIYMAFVQVVNFAIGSNYMWIARKPDFRSLIDALGPWPWYILSLEGVGVIVCLVLYLPYALMDWRKYHRERAQQT